MRTRHLQLEELQKRRIRQHELDTEENQKKAELIASQAEIEAQQEQRKIEAAHRLEEARSVSAEAVEALEGERGTSAEDVLAKLKAEGRDLEMLTAVLSLAESSPVGALAIDENNIYSLDGSLSPNPSSPTQKMGSHRERLEFTVLKDAIFNNEILTVIKNPMLDMQTLQMTRLGYGLLDILRKPKPKRV